MVLASQEGYQFKHTTPFSTKNLEKSLCDLTETIFVQCENSVFLTFLTKRSIRKNRTGLATRVYGVGEQAVKKCGTFFGCKTDGPTQVTTTRFPLGTAPTKFGPFNTLGSEAAQSATHPTARSLGIEPAKFSTGAVNNLQIGGALTRIIFDSGALLSKF